MSDKLPPHRLFGVPMIGSARMGEGPGYPSYEYLFYANGEVIKRIDLIKELRDLGYTFEDGYDEM